MDKNKESKNRININDLQPEDHDFVSWVKPLNNEFTPAGMAALLSGKVSNTENAWGS